MKRHEAGRVIMKARQILIKGVEWRVKTIWSRIKETFVKMSRRKKRQHRRRRRRR